MKKRNENIKFWAHFALIFALLICGQYFAKSGAIDLTLGNMREGYLQVAFGYGFLITRGIAWIFLLRYVNVSIAYSVQSLSFIFIMFLSYLMFNETITIQKLLSATMIVTGIILVIRNKE